MNRRLFLKFIGAATAAVAAAPALPATLLAPAPAPEPELPKPGTCGYQIVNGVAFMWGSAGPDGMVTFPLVCRNAPTVLACTRDEQPAQVCHLGLTRCILPPGALWIAYGVMA